MEKNAGAQEQIVNSLSLDSRSPSQGLQILTSYSDPSLGWVARAAQIRKY